MHEVLSLRRSEKLVGPKLLNGIVHYLIVNCGQDEAMMNCLANQHAIEWIPMNWRELENLPSSARLERKTNDSVLLLFFLKILISWRRQL